MNTSHSSVREVGVIDSDLLEAFLRDLDAMADGKSRRASLKTGSIAASLHVFRENYYFRTLVVHEAYRNRGLGRATFEIITTWADRRGIRLILNAQPKDEKIPLLGLMMMYEKIGFFLMNDLHQIGKDYLTMERLPKNGGQ